MIARRLLLFGYSSSIERIDNIWFQKPIQLLDSRTILFSSILSLQPPQHVSTFDWRIHDWQNRRYLYDYRIRIFHSYWITSRYIRNYDQWFPSTFNSIFIDHHTGKVHIRNRRGKSQHYHYHNTNSMVQWRWTIS